LLLCVVLIGDAAPTKDSIGGRNLTGQQKYSNGIIDSSRISAEYENKKVLFGFV